MRRVVITGMGIYSCIGKNREEVRDSLYYGRSGVGLDLSRKEMGFRSCLTGIIDPPNLKDQLDRKQRATLSEQGNYACAATLEALEQAKIDMDFLSHNEVGILYGNDSCVEPIVNTIDITRSKKDNTLIGSASVFKSMNSTITMNLAVILNLKGINMTISGACASGSHSVGLGHLLIQQGLQDIIICGGAQEVNTLSMASLDGLGLFSMQENEPKKASRPFDRDRDGLVPSGGGATIILESYESAVKRGITPLGEVLGYGFSSNGNHNISTPDANGLQRSLEMAIKQADIPIEKIKYINAHATSTPKGDAEEASAIAEIFKNHNPYVASTKSITGNEMWMSGASEIIYALLMMHNNFIAPNINFENPDEASAKLNIPNKKIDIQFETFLSNSSGFGGTNSTLIIQKI